jgi:hypothetical protein
VTLALASCGRPAEEGRIEEEYSTNLVVPGGAALLGRFLEGRGADLTPVTRAFYERYRDDYDFLYLVVPAHAEDSLFGRFMPIRRPAMPTIGLTDPLQDPGTGSEGRLKAIVVLNFSDEYTMPVGHETLHYWSQYLDPSFGFDRGHTYDYDGHWGISSVHGQHGGFDLATLRCAEPANSLPPCTPGSNGRVRYTAAMFGPTANGGDSVRYAPIELYLMGLATPEEVPPITVLDDADPLYDERVAGEPVTIDAAGQHTVTIDEIIARHGRRPEATAEERAFRGAFVVVSDAPVSDAVLRVVDDWSRVFGNARPGDRLSFEAMTGGRATMQTRLGARR